MEEIKTINEKITHMEETNPVQAAIDQVQKKQDDQMNAILKKIDEQFKKTSYEVNLKIIENQTLKASIHKKLLLEDASDQEEII